MGARKPRLHLLAFVFLGLRFMVVEIALFQKLMLYLGQPQRAFSVLLAALLPGGGLGAQASAWLRLEVERSAAIACAAAAGLVVAAPFMIPLIFQVDLDPRLGAVLTLLPIGFALGMSFPLRLRSLAARGGGGGTYVHAVWGVNSVASVLGSALSTIVGLTVGFSFAMFLGAALSTFALHRGGLVGQGGSRSSSKPSPGPARSSEAALAR